MADGQVEGHVLDYHTISLLEAHVIPVKRLVRWARCCALALFIPGLVPAAQAQRMQPWAAMMTLSVPPPKTGLFMDFSLSLRASGAGVRVIGLETLDEQLSFLEGMNLDQQLAMLDHAIEESGRAQQVHDELVDIYLAGDLQVLHEHAMEQLQEVDEAARETFLQQGIVLRNRRMLEAAEPHLQGGGAFIAVGSLHLTGETGLLKLLSDSGYDLEPAGWPFIAKP